MNDDRNTYAISGLKRKRGLIAGQVMVVEAQLKTLRADMAAIDRSVMLLDPTIEPKRLKVILTRHRFKYFEAGELAKLIFAELSKGAGKPVNVPALLAGVMTAKASTPNIWTPTGPWRPGCWPSFTNCLNAAPSRELAAGLECPGFLAANS